MRRAAIAAACLVSLCTSGSIASDAIGAGKSDVVLRRAYVWQRAWPPPVVRAVKTHGPAFDALDVLAAEIACEPKPSAVTVAPNWSALAATRRPVALVVRIGASRSDWSASDPATQLVLTTCQQVLANARAHRVPPVELQIDFDAASSRLREYRTLIAAIRSVVAPPQLTITTLPAWLDQGEFRALVAAVDSFVLQVHSLNKPRSVADGLVLFDAGSAQRWIATAASMGRPFRVALPSYGYRVAFRASGEFLGLEAEGPPRTWPEDAIIRTVIADPAPIADLVRKINYAPAGCQAVGWFRLPNEDDAVGWGWETLAAVMHGLSPVPRLTVRAQPGADGTLDVVIANEGSGAASVSRATLAWSGARMVAAEAVAGWGIVASRDGTLVLGAGSAAQPTALRPGDAMTIGWVRLDAVTDVLGRAE